MKLPDTQKHKVKLFVSTLLTQVHMYLMNLGM